MFDESEITCPYCGEPNTVFFEASEGSQVTVTDCTVCCRPIKLDIRVEESAADEDSEDEAGGHFTVRASRE